MPSFAQYPQSPSIKMLYLGHSGAGKTGSLCSLASAGYRVRILDLDNKAEIIRGFLSGDAKSNPKSIYLKELPGLWTSQQAAAAPSNISYVPMAEEYSLTGLKATPRGTAWNRANQLLNNWKDGEDTPGNLGRWSPNDVLVIDSFSRFCEAAMNFQLAMNGRLEKGPQVGTKDSNDYSAAYKYITDFLNLLKSSEIKCHIIIIGHIVFMEPSGPQTTISRGSKGYTQVFGRALISPTISQYFPHVLLAKSIGNEPSVKRTIITNNDENVELITTAPLQVKREYPLETGLAEYFRDVLQQKEPQT